MQNKFANLMRKIMLIRYLSRNKWNISERTDERLSEKLINYIKNEGTSDIVAVC